MFQVAVLAERIHSTFVAQAMHDREVREMVDNRRTRKPSGVDATNPEQGLNSAVGGAGMGATTTSQGARQEQLQDEAEPNDFVQLMYEQSSELDAVDRIARERKQRR